MPSVSRGLYRWLFQRAAVLEDFADRLNHFWTVSLLLLFSCIISWKQGYNKPINCWCPSQFTQSMIQYSESSCWNNYVIQYPRDVEKAAERLNISESDYIWRSRAFSQPIVSEYPLDSESSMLTKASSTVTMYQWLPVILCFQALLFKLPNVILYIFHSFTGVSFDKIAGLTIGYENMNLQERHVLGRQMARYLSQWCRTFENCLPWRFLTLLLLLVKLLYCINIIVQLAVLDAFLTTNDPPVDNSTSFGTAITDNIYENNATLWKESPVFPRVVFCKFSIMQLQSIQPWQVQCRLPVNDFNEHAYMFIWVWFVFVAVVTCVSLVVWLIRTIVPVFRKRYITRVLENAEGLDLNAYSPANLSNFCDVIGEDGVMVLKLASANSSEFVVRDVLSCMWTHKFGASGYDASKDISGHASVPEVLVDTPGAEPSEIKKCD